MLDLAHRVTPPAADNPGLNERLLRQRLAVHRAIVAPRGPTTRVAAVAAVLRFSPAAEVLLIKRAEHPNDPWSGHMALPGGRQDEADATTLQTAVRETHEEVGLDLSEYADGLGQLDDVQAIARARRLDMVIVPHVFVLRGSPSLVLEPGEVEAAIWAPLEPMSSNRTATTRPYVHEGRALELPGWTVGEHVVWGLTYTMLQSLFDVLRSPA